MSRRGNPGGSIAIEGCQIVEARLGRDGFIAKPTKIVAVRDQQADSPSDAQTIAASWCVPDASDAQASGASAAQVASSSGSQVAGNVQADEGTANRSGGQLGEVDRRL